MEMKSQSLKAFGVSLINEGPKGDNDFLTCSNPAKQCVWGKGGGLSLVLYYSSII